MLIIICSNGDGNSASYNQAEQAFVRRLLDQKASSIPKDTKIKTFSNPQANFPDVNNQMTTQMFLTVLLKKMSIDPYEAKLSWKAELFKEFGYTFVTFFCTADNPSYSFEVTEKPKAPSLKGFLNALFGRK